MFLEIISGEDMMQREKLKYEFINFSKNIDLPKKDNDPLRSYTINAGLDDKLIINGLCLIHYYSLCKFSLMN